MINTHQGKNSGTTPRSGTGSPNHRNSRIWYAGFIAIITAVMIISPVSAASKYMAGSPELSAYISGTNEVSPGDTVSLKVIIENKGVNEFKFIQSSIIERDDLPNTAKFLTVSLAPGDAPIVVKSDPQMLGDLKGSSTASCVFTTKIQPDAAAGVYNLPLLLKYSYMYEAEQYGLDTIQYYYKERNETFSLPITIRPELKIQVLSSEGEHLNAGTEGYITLSVKNIGHEDGKNAILRIVRNEKSPVIPTTSSIFLGDFPVDQTLTGRFKVSVSSDAEEQTYPLDVLVNYENSEGEQVTSDSETIGMAVGKKIDFNVTSLPGELSPGQKKVINVEYVNSGGATAYNVQARISAVDPFTSSDDTAFLGTLAPGESGVAAFEISVDKAATIKEYALDSEIRYRDALDNSLISNPLKVRVRVGADKGLVSGIVSNPIALSVIGVLIIGTGFFIYRQRR